VPVLIALAHDVLITAGVYALTDREVTTATVAAVLTIMGYSLYDTVIVFDRIRENVPRMPRATFSQIANRSMSEVLTRSLATSFVVLMPVGSLLLFGGETLKDFAFALLVGVASGAYSSIFIATPVLVEWKEREPVYMRRRRLAMEEHGGVVPAFAAATIGDAEEAVAEPAREPRKRPAPRRRTPARTPDRAAAPPPPKPPREDGPPPAGTDAPREPSPREARPAAGDGRAADGPAPEQAQPRVSSTAGPGKPKQKPKRRNRPRKKHGRR
jgi:SecD/SecF fusion protein